MEANLNVPDLDLNELIDAMQTVIRLSEELPARHEDR